MPAPSRAEILRRAKDAYIQLGRRNLTPDQMSFLRGRLHERTKKEQGAPTKERRHFDGVPGRTAERLAKEFGVSPKTIERDAKFAQAVGVVKRTERAQVPRVCTYLPIQAYNPSGAGASIVQEHHSLGSGAPPS